MVAPVIWYWSSWYFWYPLVPYADLIFVIFSPHRIFLDKVFSTQKYVNYDKTDFATKFVNFEKNWFFQENSINFAYMATFSTSNTCQMWRISDFSTYVMGRHLKFLHMWRNFRNLHICYVEKLEISPHDIFFLHEYNSWYSWQIWGLCCNYLLKMLQVLTTLQVLTML